MRTDSICRLNIQTPEDIDRALSERYEDRAKLYAIQKKCDMRSEDIGELFKQAYWNSLGLFPCGELLKDLDLSVQALELVITGCSDSLTPHFASAFKCHQIAYNLYRNEGRSALASEMSKTANSAKEIVAVYQRFSTGFDLVAEEVLQTILDPAFCKIRTAIVNLSFQFKRAQSHGELLIDSVVMHEDDMELFESDDVKKGGKRWQDTVVRLDLSEVASKDSPSMKTGREVAQMQIPDENGLSRRVNFSAGIVERLEDSYLKWLALAKTNLDMVSIAKDMLEDLRNCQRDLAKIELDPLAIALHQSAD